MTKPKTDPKAPGAAGAADAAAKIGDNSNKRPELTEDERRDLFLRHRTSWNGAQAKLKTAQKLLKDVVAAAKADGVPKKDLELADKLAELGGEAKVRDGIEQQLRVAKYLGLPLGAQLSMFGEPDRTPVVDRAFDEGKQASMEGHPAKPPHSPETEAYRAYMAGYAEDQSRRAGTLGRGDAAKH